MLKKIVMAMLAFSITVGDVGVLRKWRRCGSGIGYAFGVFLGGILRRVFRTCIGRGHGNSGSF